MSLLRRSDFALTQQQVALQVRFSPHHFVKYCARLYDVYVELPERHDWLFDSGEGVVARMEQARVQGGTPSLGYLYTSLLEDLEALLLVHAWKAREATVGAVWALNQRSLATSAMAARGALEAATVSVDVSLRHMRLRDEVNRLGGMGAPGTVDLVASFEERTLRALWGRRGEGVMYEIPAINILTHQSAMARNLSDDGGATTEIKNMHAPVYGLLSSMAHPSADGNQAYWHLDSAVELGPTSVVPLQGRPDFRDAHLQPLIAAVLWALGWSAPMVVSTWSQVRADRLLAIRTLNQ